MLRQVIARGVPNQVRELCQLQTMVLMPLDKEDTEQAEAGGPGVIYPSQSPSTGGPGPGTDAEGRKIPEDGFEGHEDLPKQGTSTGEDDKSRGKSIYHRHPLTLF